MNPSAQAFPHAPQFSVVSSDLQTPSQTCAAGQHRPPPMQIEPSGQHSPPQHCSGVAQQSWPHTLRPAAQHAPPAVHVPSQQPPLAHWSSPGHGSGVSVVVVGAGVVGGGGAAMRGRLPLVRASASGRTVSPATAAPPSPSSPFSILRRDVPEASAFVNRSNRCPSIYPLPA
jgi:hypothetical protein